MPDTVDQQEIKRWRANLQGEIDGAWIYTAMAEAESQPELAEVYRRMAAAERRHADFWLSKLREAGIDIGSVQPSWRARTLARLARWFGPQLILPTIAQQEQIDRSAYDAQPEARAARLPADEHSHARLLSLIAENSRRGIAGPQIARLEGRHHAVGGNALRAAVLGANDGLVSNLSLVMGVAGAELAAQDILITGLAGLLAGAGSMAMGEWLSVQSSRELYQRQIAIEAAELEEAPEEEQEELALIFQAKGLPEEDAQKLAAELMADKTQALDSLSREELGIDPDELGGSAWGAAAISFVLFAIGAIVPVFPFIFLAGSPAVLASAACSAVALFGIGAAVSLLTGRSLWFSGLRQLIIGAMAAGLTYGVGTLIGVSISS